MGKKLMLERVDATYRAYVKYLKHVFVKLGVSTLPLLKKPSLKLAQKACLEYKINGLLFWFNIYYKTCVSSLNDYDNETPCLY